MSKKGIFGNRVVFVEASSSKVLVGEARMTSTGWILGKLGGKYTRTEEDGLQSSLCNVVRDLMRELQIRGGAAVVVVPSRIVFPRFVKIPPVMPEKIDIIVKYEAQQNVPFPMDEVVWDYSMYGERTDWTAAIVAAKRDVLEQTFDALEACELRVEAAVPSFFCVANAAMREASTLALGSGGCTMVLDCGRTTTSVIFVQGDRLYVRGIPVGGDAVTRDVMSKFDLSWEESEVVKLSPPDLQAEYMIPVRNVFVRLHAEVARTINFYRSQMGGDTPSRCLLTGGVAGTPGIAEFLGEKFKIPVSIMSAFSNYPTALSVDARSDAARDSRFLASLEGACMYLSSGFVTPVNLAPRAEYRKPVKKAWARIQAFVDDLTAEGSDACSLTGFPAAGGIGVK